jgi:hypothetical protein
MAISSGQTSVGLTPTAIDGRSANPSRIVIHNNDNSTNIWLGGSNVSTTNGLILLKEQTYQIDLEPLEQLFAISEKTGHVISWLRQTI